MITTFFLFVAAFSNPGAIETCNHYNDELKVAAGLDDESDGAFKDKAIVDKVIKKIDLKVGSAPEIRANLDKVSKNPGELKEEDLSNLFFDPSCSTSVIEYRALKRLLASIRALKMKEKEKEVVDLVAGYLKRGSDAPSTLVELATKASILKKMVDQNFLKLKESQKKEVEALKGKIESAKDYLRSQGIEWPETKEAFQKLTDEKKKELLQFFKTEMAKTEEIRKELKKALAVLP